MSRGFLKVNSVGGEGTLALNLTDVILTEADELGIGPTFLSAGAPDHNRATLFHSRTRRRVPGVNTGLRPDEVRETQGYLADPERAERGGNHRRALDQHLNDLHVAAARQAGVDSPFDLFIFSWDSGHTRPAIESLRDRSVRLPSEVRCGLTVLPHERYLRDGLRFDPDLLIRLKEERLLEGTVVLDNLSATAARDGRAYQDRLAAKGFAAMMAGIWHFPNQRGPSDIVHALAHYGAMHGMSFGVRHLLATPEIGWYRPFRQLLGSPPKGLGSAEDATIQTIAAIEQAVTDPSQRAIDEEPDPHKQAFVILTVPVGRRDLAKWRRLVTDVELWLTNRYPYITAVWASGQGAAPEDLAATSAYWVQASLLYPLPDRPRTLQRILDSDSLQRRKSQPAGRNGSGPTKLGQLRPIGASI